MYTKTMAQEVVQMLGLPEYLEISEIRTQIPDAPAICLNGRRIIGGDLAVGINVIRRRSVLATNLLEALPIEALKKMHSSLSGSGPTS